MASGSFRSTEGESEGGSPAFKLKISKEHAGGVWHAGPGPDIEADSCGHTAVPCCKTASESDSLIDCLASVKDLCP
eukprot:3628193-Amphidinium_carterae.1